MKFSEMKRAAHNWLADQKVWLSIMVNPESINRDVDIAEGFIDALHLLGIYSTDQAKEAYGKLRAAHDEAMKKTALSAGNTESGKDKSPLQSVAENPGEVKAPQATARELADTLLRLIHAMQQCHIDDGRIVGTPMAHQEGNCK